MTESYGNKMKITVKPSKKDSKSSLITHSLPDLTKQLNISASEGHAKEVKKLLHQGASVHSHGPVGMNPLHLAALNGHLDVCKQLVTVGVVIDCFNKIGKSPLHLAAVNGHADVVNYLLQNGASVNHQDMLHMTPLHWACDRGHLEVVMILLKYYADPHCENKYHKTPLMLAKENQHAEIMNYVENYISGLQEKEEMKSSTPHSEHTEDAETAESSSATTDAEEKLEDLNHKYRYEVESDDEESKVQDSILASLNELEEAVRMGTLEKPFEICVNDASELFRLEAALGTLGDPSRFLLKAMSNGRTFHLTEAGVQALDMIKPDPFIIPYESETSQKDDSEGEDELRRKTSGSQPISASSSATTNACNAVVLHTPTNDIKGIIDRAFTSMASTSGNNSVPPNFDESAAENLIEEDKQDWRSPLLDEEMSHDDSLIDFDNLTRDLEYFSGLDELETDLYNDTILETSLDPQLKLWTQLPFPSTSYQSHHYHQSQSKGPPSKKTKL